MTISLRLNNEDAALIRKYADMKGISVSELVRRSVLDKSKMSLTSSSISAV